MEHGLARGQYRNVAFPATFQQPLQTARGVAAARTSQFREGVARCPTAVVRRQNGHLATTIDSSQKTWRNVEDRSQSSCPRCGDEFHRLGLRHTQAEQGIDRRIENGAFDGREVRAGRRGHDPSMADNLKPKE